MTRVWFVVPVHGREALTHVCLRQLRRTCDAASAYGVEATAVVIGIGESLGVARDLGFATVERDNDFLGRRFNDGYQLACDPAYNPEPADYVIPCGSDDWFDPALLSVLPDQRHIAIFRQLAIVNEDRTELIRANVSYKTAAGPKIIPRGMLEACGWRPSCEDRRRAIDSSTVEGIKRSHGGSWPAMVNLDQHPLQIVDWKSAGEQLNSFQMMRGYARGRPTEDPFEALAGVYPDEALAEMRNLHLTPSEVSPIPLTVAA
jgi:hypothetical protein